MSTPFLKSKLLVPLLLKPQEAIMTEDQIEDYFERIMDALDRKFTYDIISEHDYNLKVESLKEWAEEQLSKLQ
jgi:hypothetical protein